MMASMHSLNMICCILLLQLQIVRDHKITLWCKYGKLTSWLLSKSKSLQIRFFLRVFLECVFNLLDRLYLQKFVLTLAHYNTKFWRHVIEIYPKPCRKSIIQPSFACSNFWFSHNRSWLHAWLIQLGSLKVNETIIILHAQFSGDHHESQKQHVRYY